MTTRLPGGGGAAERYQAALGYADVAPGPAAYYASADGVAAGGAGWTALVMFREKWLQEAGPVQFMCGRTILGGDGGFGFGRNLDQLKFWDTNGVGTVLENFAGLDWPNPGTPTDFASGTIGMFGMTHNDTDTFASVNGRNQRDLGVAGFTAGTGPFLVGVDLIAGASGHEAYRGAILAVAFHGTRILTEDEMFELWLSSRDAMTIPDLPSTIGGVDWTNRWVFAGEAAGPAPATITDLGTGGNDLTLVGALTVESRRPVFLQVGGS